MLALRDAIPRATPFARAECATLRLRLPKIGARVVERAARIRIHFAFGLPGRPFLPPTRRAPRSGRPLIGGAPRAPQT